MHEILKYIQIQTLFNFFQNLLKVHPGHFGNAEKSHITNLIPLFLKKLKYKSIFTFSKTYRKSTKDIDTIQIVKTIKIGQYWDSLPKLSNDQSSFWNFALASLMYCMVLATDQWRLEYQTKLIKLTKLILFTKI
jgi:hypothetical protein